MIEPNSTTHCYKCNAPLKKYGADTEYIYAKCSAGCDVKRMILRDEWKDGEPPRILCSDDAREDMYERQEK